MATIDEGDLRTSLGKAEKACKRIRTVLLVCLAACVIAWVSILGVIAYGCLSDIGGTFVLLYCFLYGAVVISGLLMLNSVFATVVKGAAPFSERQASRLRIIALLALLLVVLELLFTAGVSYEIAPSVGYGVVINNGASEPTVNLNIGMLVFSGIMYSLSAIFRYAALLQQLSDDTV